MPFYDAFLSYNSADKEAARALALRLREAGANVFFDIWDIVPGEPLQERLEQALENSQVALVLVGPQGLGRWQETELEFRLERYFRSGRGRMIPVLLPGSHPKEMPPFLRRLTWVDLRERGLDDPIGLGILMAAIRGESPKFPKVVHRTALVRRMAGTPQRRKARMSLTASAIVMSLAIVGWIYAGYQQTALVDGLKAEAVSALNTEGRTDLGMLLAIEALERNDDDPQIRALLQQAVTRPLLHGHEGPIEDVTFSPDGRWLATASEDGTARLWDVARPEEDPVVFNGHHGQVYAVAISVDGHHLATGDQDGTVRLWDLRRPQEGPVTLKGHGAPVRPIRFSPQGRWMATSGKDATVRLWDLARLEEEPFVLELDRNAGISFPDEGLLVTDNREERRLWELHPSSPPELLQRLIVDDSGMLTDAGITGSVVHISDGRFLVTRNQNVWLWVIRNASFRLEDLGRFESARSARLLTLSQDRRWLAAVGKDGQIRVWNVRNSGAERAVFEGLAERVQHMAFSPDGHWLAFAEGNDPTVRLWLHHLDEDLVTLSCRRAGRNLTGEEWQQYLGKRPYRKTCGDLPETLSSDGADRGAPRAR